MAEQRANFASTTVAGGGYTAGSGFLNVGSTSTGSGIQPFPTAGSFSVVIRDQVTLNPKTLLQVTAINSGTQFATTNNGITPDVNMNSGDIVEIVQDKRALQTLMVSAQNSVGGSRVIGTVYQNTGTNPMFVSADVSTNVNSAILVGYTDASNPPTTPVSACFSSFNSQDRTVFFIVLPGNYYKITNGSGTPSINFWIEWQ